jgi:predicted protein tyrosine phosphatase
MTITRVLFVSETHAVGMRPPKGAVLVSISVPGRLPIDFMSGWLDVLRLQFHDVDGITFPGANPGLHPISDEQALAIAEFVSRHRHAARRVVVHCRSGISRSAGVARAVALHLGIGFPPAYEEFNVFVYRSVGRALVKRAVNDERRP